MKLTIGYLYGDCMNIYGDRGNIIALQKRAQWRGIGVEVKNISLKDKLKAGEVDLFFFGGGQDQAQALVAKDLEESGKGKIIKEEIERGVPLLSICGGYQLLGEYYKPHDGPKLPGVNLFPVYTVASYDRMIGNIIVKLTDQLIVGFENHSGKTYLKEGGQPLGKVIKGFGNNGEDHTEGCIYKNAVGCYMHGSLLPKNPQFTDWFIQKVLDIKYGKKIKLSPLDDDLEIKAYQTAISRFG
ncbi:MAG: CobB/CobQ domain protein glutamine amidotransferase [Candidatus Daviesbacteria bacterium GW2011_GWA1_41_61]|uniref:Lipid II isoglutaminyl synthase (glutamine-hydrolyzing) subunit GatD n=1 Tax=Candidatus Daviesbacteria bacterium GW2011_GWA2_40_9 TaxID=1618424 RepID=A0A0G0WHH6_9BACT|nr:MAG: CobB/CobQ domain protein glutamine amidotransferase [Candidatus Daviesbacteria bacterium GW2011_GWC1_40_9]KKR83790.1 MAG: CobB/CobQ domain protein glutamine amidotransferase [Candidatus Daviesbacteria bacterium GW2011_GWA2_40_9]KKR93399.1 MAG: CobB/CobQ domain protein glutamine amidotransferase [Candidatus Daviesbacteria bacterium GW2011_GWB1_41_15]KKS15052.1 MAG: CobB/CobQ domain protein glutamine amidotransferase [Candidatus Daviesbacteria bacterium GW2011_GWA1_41_61]